MNNQINQSHTSSRYSSRHRNNKNNSQSFRGDIHQIQNQIRSLQDQIQFTICNYQSILQTQKKNTNQRNQFLLYLIQSMKQKHNQELNKYQNQLNSVLQQKQQASSLQSQMKNIGQGVDSILQEGNLYLNMIRYLTNNTQGKKLKQINVSLLKQLQQQNMRQKEIDEQIQNHNKQIQELRTQVDEWQVKKIKWNRKKKDMIQIIQDTQNVIKTNNKICPQTGISQNLNLGIQQENCQHCESLNMKKLMNKYQNNK